MSAQGNDKRNILLQQLVKLFAEFDGGGGGTTIDLTTLENIATDILNKVIQHVDVSISIESFSNAIKSFTQDTVTELDTLNSRIVSKLYSTNFKELGVFRVNSNKGTTANSGDYLRVWFAGDVTNDIITVPSNGIFFNYRTFTFHVDNITTILSGSTQCNAPLYVSSLKPRAALRVPAATAPGNTRTLAQCQVSQTDATIINLLTDNNATGILIQIATQTAGARFLIDNGGLTPSTANSLGILVPVNTAAREYYFGDTPYSRGGNITELANFRINSTTLVACEIQCYTRIL